MSSKVFSYALNNGSKSFKILNDLVILKTFDSKLKIVECTNYKSTLHKVYWDVDLVWIDLVSPVAFVWLLLPSLGLR